MQVDGYTARLLDDYVESLLDRFSAVLITGPRATGKTTTAERLARTKLSLDQPRQASVARADPDAVVRDRPTPILIDEWQVAPAVLGAVKRAVDRNHEPGQFIVTGSVRADLEESTWPGTGRLLRVPMFGLTTRERSGNIQRRGFLDQILTDGLEALPTPPDPPDLRGYVAELLVSGFPVPAVQLEPSDRAVWLESYIDEVVTRDVDLVTEVRASARLRRYLEVLAANTAGIVNDATLYEAAGVNRRTGTGYEELFQALYLLDVVPAWWTNRVKRLTQRPKRFLVDAAMAAAVVRINEDGLLGDGDMLGRLIETFVFAQLRAEAPVSVARPRFFHLRTEGGRQEVDIVAELPGQKLIGIEVKATSHPSKEDARHLIWFREVVGDRFLAGVVFHTGPYVFNLADDIVAVPIAALWQG